jgi:hypothetical protein
MVRRGYVRIDMVGSSMVWMGEEGYGKVTIILNFHQVVCGEFWSDEES